MAVVRRVTRYSMCSKPVVIENADPHVLIEHTQGGPTAYSVPVMLHTVTGSYRKVKSSGRRIGQVEDALDFRPRSDEYPRPVHRSQQRGLARKDEEVLTCTVQATDTSQGSRVDAIGVMCPAVHIH